MIGHYFAQSLSSWHALDGVVFPNFFFSTEYRFNGVSRQKPECAKIFKKMIGKKCQLINETNECFVKLQIESQNIEHFNLLQIAFRAFFIFFFSILNPNQKSLIQSKDSNSFWKSEYCNCILNHNNIFSMKGQGHQVFLFENNGESSGSKRIYTDLTHFTKSYRSLPIIHGIVSMISFVINLFDYYDGFVLQIWFRTIIDIVT